MLAWNSVFYLSLVSRASFRSGPYFFLLAFPDSLLKCSGPGLAGFQGLAEFTLGFPSGSVIKNPPANAGDARDVGSIPGSGRSPGVGNGHPLQYFCLENPMNRGAWRATVHGVAKIQTWLSRHALTHITWYGRRESLLLTRTRAPAAWKWKPIPYFVFWTSGKLRALLYYSTVLVYFLRAYETFEIWKKSIGS